MAGHAYESTEREAKRPVVGATAPKTGPVEGLTPGTHLSDFLETSPLQFIVMLCVL